MEKLNENIEKARSQYIKVIEEDSKKRDEQLESINRAYENIKNGTIKIPIFMHELDSANSEEDYKEGAGACGCLLI